MTKPLYCILAGIFVSLWVASTGLAENRARGQPVPRVERWEPTILEFEALDAQKPSPRGAVLLVGGSNARRWTDVERFFPGHQVINRGFGGARLTEVLHFADRIVLPYAPKVILVNAGGNDLSAGSTPAQVRESAEALVKKIRANLPDTRIIFIGLPYVQRAYKNPESKALISGMNVQLAKMAEREDKVEFVDVASAFLDDKGAFRPELFVKDGTHYSPKGYAVVAGLFQDRL